LFEEQARRYGGLFDMFLEFSDYMPRITSFIWVDLPAEQGAWRRWPHSQHPALFDINRQTKPAFYAILESLENAAPANISIPEVTTSHLTFGEVGENFSTQIRAVQSNHAPIRWRVESGELPPGSRIVAATGAIIGTPESEGAFTFTVAAETALGSGTRELTLAIGEAYYTPAEPEIPTEPTPDEPTPAEDTAATEPTADTPEPTPAVEDVSDDDGGLNVPLVVIIVVMVVLLLMLAFAAVKKWKEKQKK
jgi:hypothetical protein